MHTCIYVTPLLKILASQSGNEASYSRLCLHPFALIILVKVYLVSVPHYRDTVLCDCLSVSGVEDYKHITMTTCRKDNINDVMGVRNN